MLGILSGALVLAVLICVALRYVARFARGVRIVRRKPGGTHPAPSRRTRERPARRAPESRPRLEVNALVAAAVRWARAGGPAWRLGGHSVHRLPWYLVVGERGAGTSTLSRAFGQRAEDRASRGSAAGDEGLLRGWFGKDAVMFEATLGQPDSQASWHALIGRLRRVRRACPANGIVVAVPVRQLIDGDDASRTRFADDVRVSIGACHRLWKRRVPVYVLVTQCDRLTGFESFAGDWADRAYASPLGLVFPLGAPTTGDAWSTGFAHGFEALARGVRAQVVARMPVRADAWRAAMTFGFPQAFEALAAPLSEFLRDAFEASPGAAETPLLRGVHFCAVPRTTAAMTSHVPLALPPAPGPERAYFVDGFFRQTLFGERALVRSRHALPHRRIVAARVAAAACAVLAACAAAGLVSAYRRGTVGVAATASPAAALVGAARAGVDLRSPRAMLPLLGQARGLPCGKAWQAPGEAWLASLDLAREVRLEAACRAAYATALRETVQPYLVERMTTALRDTSQTPSEQFETLRAYSMLGERSHFDEATVLAWIAADARRTALLPAERAAWLAHCAAWAAAAKGASGLPLDGELIGEVRARLGEQPRAQRLFESLMPALRAAVPEPLSVAEMAGPAAALVFYRKSGARLSDGVPGAYTLAGLRRYFGVRDAALARARRDEWVLGRPGLPPAGPGELASSVDRLYFEGYVQAWEAVIDDVALRPLPRSGDAAARVSLLAGPDSPLRALLARAAKETTTVGVGAGRGPEPNAPERGPDSAGTVGRTLRQWFGGITTTKAAGERTAQGGPARGAIVDDRFAALHRLVTASDAGGGNALGEVQAQLKEVAVYLRAADAARASGLPAPGDDVLDSLTQRAAALPEPLGSMLGSLAREGTNSARSAARSRIDERWRAEAGAFCHAAVDGRYPFSPNGDDEITPDDFTRLFASGGLLDAFFQTYLKPYADTSATPWVWRPRAAPPGMAIAALREFERAARIREAFFSGDGKTMNVRFTLTPRGMDAGLTRFVLAGGVQVLDYAHEAPRATSFTWPDGAGGRTARIEFAPASADGGHGFETHGAWALLRLLDLGRLEARTADRFVLTYDLDGKRVTLDLAASSVVNPFAGSALHAFRCPSGF